jgi:hypothetical protein
MPTPLSDEPPAVNYRRSQLCSVALAEAVHAQLEGPSTEQRTTCPANAPGNGKMAIHWLVGLAAALIAASQFSHISTATGFNLALTCIGGGIAILGVSIGLYHTIRILAPAFETLDSITALATQSKSVKWLDVPKQYAKDHGCELSQLKATLELNAAPGADAESIAAQRTKAKKVLRDVMPLMAFFKAQYLFARLEHWLPLALGLIAGGMIIFTYFANRESVGASNGGQLIVNVVLNINAHRGGGIIDSGPVPPSISPSFHLLGRITGFAFDSAGVLDKTCQRAGETLSVCQSSQMAKLHDSISTSGNQLEALLLFGSADKNDFKPNVSLNLMRLWHTPALCQYAIVYQI